MTTFERLSRVSLGLLLVGLAVGCASNHNRGVLVPEIIPAQVCGGNADSDGDGVNECNDRCPGTLAGQSVDSDGCPLPEPVMEPKPFRG